MQRFSSFEKLKDATNSNQKTQLKSENEVISFIELLKDSVVTSKEIAIEEYLMSISPECPVLRKFLTKDEIKIANKLVKDKKLSKGISDDKHKNVIFYCNI